MLLFLSVKNEKENRRKEIFENIENTYRTCACDAMSGYGKKW